MRSSKVLLILVCVVTGGLLTASASASLVAQVDYADTYSIGGARPDQTLIAYGGPGGYTSPIEYARAGVPAANWTQAAGFNASYGWVQVSLSSTAMAVWNTYPGNDPSFGYSAPGNPGDATGMGQVAGSVASIPYGLRTNYTVSADFNWLGRNVWTGPSSPTNYVAISSFTAAGSALDSTGGLSVFFRRAGAPAYGDEITLFNGVTETGTGIHTGITDAGTPNVDTNAGTWHNFGVQFNQDNNTLGLYVDQALMGTVNVATFADGLYSTYSNGAVGIGAPVKNNNNYPATTWFDNFEVGGAVVPEPSVITLLATGLLGLLAYAWRKRK